MLKTIFQMASLHFEWAWFFEGNLKISLPWKWPTTEAKYLVWKKGTWLIPVLATETGITGEQFCIWHVFTLSKLYFKGNLRRSLACLDMANTEAKYLVWKNGTRLMMAVINWSASFFYLWSVLRNIYHYTFLTLPHLLRKLSGMRKVSGLLQVLLTKIITLTRQY